MQEKSDLTEDQLGLLLIEADDRDFGSALLLRGKVVIEVNYDEHGSAGAELLRQAGDRLSEILGVPLIKEEMSDGDYKTFMGWT